MQVTLHFITKDHSLENCNSLKRRNCAHITVKSIDDLKAHTRKRLTFYQELSLSENGTRHTLQVDKEVDISRKSIPKGSS